MATPKELTDLMRYEIVQQREEGSKVEGIEECVERALKGSDGLGEPELYAILRELESLQPTESFSYVEPSTLDDIRAERPDGPRRMELNLADAKVLDRIHGAWLDELLAVPWGSPWRAGLRAILMAIFSSQRHYHWMITSLWWKDIPRDSDRILPIALAV